MENSVTDGIPANDAMRNAVSDPSPRDTCSPYLSFWQAGFEGADHINGSAQPLCMNSMTDHYRQAPSDYARLAVLGLKTVRESASWRQIDRNGRFDFSRVEALSKCAKQRGLQILWTCFHYGVPADVDIFSDPFPGRFADYCNALAHAVKPHRCGDLPAVYTPINEISFLTWAICETGLIHPHLGIRPEDGYALKKHLVRAAILAADAIREADPDAKMLAVDPLVHASPGCEEDREGAARLDSFQFQAWDMLAGELEPQLGGSSSQLDLVGANYYPSNQWDYATRQMLEWPDHPRRRPLSDMLLELHRRYQRPVTLSETSHTGASRGPWLDEVAEQTGIAMRAGADIQGICLYPALDRPDWEQPANWHQSGLWHVHPSRFDRRIDPTYARALVRARATLETASSPIHSPAPRQSMDTLIVFSHLRWDFVYQRPQHLLSRLAGHWNIIVVEEPIAGAGELEVREVAEGVTVVRPQLAEGGRGFADEHMDSVAAMLTEYLAQQRIERYGVWFYTPMALPLLRQLDPEVIVYDCMDELSGFKNAPAQLVARENTLLKISNLVFTGGPSLYDAKRDRNADTHCFPSSVEAAHFQTAASPAIAGEWFQSIPGPRLGFYGVIDERLDIELVARLAAARSDWQICLVGPVVKIDPASLPQAPNLHYFPQQSYEELPQSLAAWDLCLLPFALNESTRFISPTKTLEYMCASKPIVSTAIADVSRLYGDGVSVAHDHDQFIAACSALLEETAEQARARAERQAALVETTSWDRTAEAMIELVFAAAEQGLTTHARNYLDRPQVVGLPLKDSGSQREIQVDCLIAGAGPTGLSAAYHLGQSSLLIEANDEVGGWCRSIEDKGFTFDYAGHIMFSKDPYVLDLYEKLLGDNLHWQDREAWVYSKGVHTRYPFQGALHGLPPEVLKECLVGAIEARFGSLDGVAQLAPSGGVPANEPGALTDCCADGVVPDTTGEGDVKDQMPSTVANFPSGKGPRNFEEFIYQVWGKGVAKHFAVPYNLKLWTVPLQEMETSWLGGRVPLPDLEEMIDGALTPVSKPVGPNARFGYPLRGGFQALMTGFLPHLRGQLRLSTRLVGIDIAAHTALLSDGSRVRYGSLISTLPLPELVRIIGDEAPGYVQRAASALRHVSVRCVNLGIARPALTNKHWIYYPEQTVFHRIFVQGNASPHNNPEQGFGLTCEITYSPTKPLPCDGQELIDRCIRECREVGMLSAEDEVITGNIVDMPYAYVIYDHARADNVARIRSWLASRDIVLAGRYSEWEYYNSDHAFIAGKNAAENVMAAEQARGQRA